MKIMLLVAASLLAVPAGAFQDRTTSDRCKPINVMMGAYKTEPVMPERSTKGIIMPNAQIESTGPAVLAPDCRREETRRRRKNDYPMA
jgi:hypothetical protein